jgi:uncharacterized protein
MVDSSSSRFIWHELLTTDVRGAKAFYADIVGWGTRDVSIPGPAYSFFTFEDAPVTAVMNLPEEARRAGAMPCWMGYVKVDDVDTAVDRISRLGGRVRVPPTTIPNISRFSVVADPQMASFVLVQGLKPSQTPFPKPNTLGRVGWHELFATDWETAFVFYNELFGWKKEDIDAGPTGAYQRFSAGGETIGAMSNKPPTMPLPFWLYYFNVDDIEAAANRVGAGGGQVLYGPIEVPGGTWTVHCMDPQGAIFGLLNRPSRKPVGYFIPGPEPSGA